MKKLVSVTYFHQSAFAVAVGRTLLMFSYHMPEDVHAAYHVNEQDLAGFANILFFVPNASKEHLDDAIFQYGPGYPITYVVSRDAERFVPTLNPRVHLVDAGDTLTVTDALIQVCPSTDKGVSFLVKTHGVSVFHAGDLNLWHWKEESTPQEVMRAENLFYETVGKIPHGALDICLFPLDPNLGGHFDAGANHAIMALKPRVFFPMHFGYRGEVAEDYARRMYSRRTAVCALTKVRETAQIDLDQTPVSLSVSGMTVMMEGVGQVRSVSLNTYLADNPFSDTDLPVDL